MKGARRRASVALVPLALLIAGLCVPCVAAPLLGDLPALVAQADATTTHLPTVRRGTLHPESSALTRFCAPSSSRWIGGAAPSSSFCPTVAFDAPGRGVFNLLRHSGDRSRPYIRFNRSHAGARPTPRGRGPSGGRLQSHHPVQRGWAEENLARYGYDADLAPTLTLETGRGFPHSIVSARQNARRLARIRSGQSRWSSTIDEELEFLVGDFRAGGFNDDAIQTVLEQQYRMLDKLGVRYTRPPGF